MLQLRLNGGFGVFDTKMTIVALTDATRGARLRFRSFANDHRSGPDFSADSLRRDFKGVPDFSKVRLARGISNGLLTADQIT
jgi:hypothetical protein